MTTDALISQACPKIGDQGAAFYFAPPTLARGEELGLDVFSFYFLGRGGVLGDVESAVVASAFGYFNPVLVASMWDAATKVLAPRQGGREYVRCCQEFGRQRLADVRGLEAFCAAAGAINAAAAAKPAGLALYAGWAAEPLADDPPAQAMQLLADLRELRGSAHLVGVLASDLDPATAHFMKRPEMYGTFGWEDANPPEVTQVHRDRLAAAEALTDRLVTPAFSVLDQAGERSLLDGLAGIEAALAAS